MKLAILDWGIGGLGFYSLFKKAYPETPTVYWSDSGFTPYGLVSRPQLQSRIKKIAQNLRKCDVSFLVIACNAASSAFAQNLETPFSITTPRGSLHATGVIAPTLHSCRQLTFKTIGVIGGRRTILSGIYRRELSAAGYLVRQRIAQPLSAKIEAGDIDSAQFHQDLLKILPPLRGMDAVIMGCTHYPAAESAISHHLPQTHLIDSAKETMKRLKHWYTPHSMAESDLFLTTGDPVNMRFSAAAAFNVDLPHVDQVCLT
ncbi:MAG: hypothetical protein C0621_04685 [Desulfuromonas sp.]|nr:MAG: hypothetical protein C0621_04685 [Desulfuromonas sp.]